MPRSSVRTWLTITGLLALALTGFGSVAASGFDDADTRWHGRGVVRVTKIVTGEDAPVDAAFDICLTGPLPGDTTRCKTLRGGETITFHDLEPGDYSLAERDVPLGFAVSYSASEFIVLKDRFTDITVTNHYTPPTPEVGRAEVTKIVTGDDAPDDAVYEVYEICLIGPLPDDTSSCRSVTGGATAVFDNLPTGTYTLTEPTRRPASTSPTAPPPSRSSAARQRPLRSPTTLRRRRGVSDAATDRATDDRSTDDRSTDDRATDDRSTDDRATDDRSTDDRSTDDRSTDDRSTEPPDGGTGDRGRSCPRPAAGSDCS